MSDIFNVNEWQKHSVEVYKEKFSSLKSTEAWFKETSPLGYEIVITSLLANDPARPNKRSKTLKIVFGTELVQDYNSSLDRKIRRQIQDIISNFEPKHSSSGIPEESFKVLAG